MSHKLWPPNGGLSQYILNQFEPGYQGWGVDVGASDGISINTTYALEKSHRWTILSVEANSDFTEMLKKHRAFVEMCAVSDKAGEAEFTINSEFPEALSSLSVTGRKELHEPYGKIAWKKHKVRVDTVESLMQKWQFPQLDVLCVDTEGTELDVLRGTDIARYKPKVIVVEVWDRVGPIDPYLEELGYKKKARNVDNDIWVRVDE